MHERRGWLAFLRGGNRYMYLNLTVAAPLHRESLAPKHRESADGAQSCRVCPGASKSVVLLCSATAGARPHNPASGQRPRSWKCLVHVLLGMCYGVCKERMPERTFPARMRGSKVYKEWKCALCMLHGSLYALLTVRQVGLQRMHGPCYIGAAPTWAVRTAQMQWIGGRNFQFAGTAHGRAPASCTRCFLVREQRG